MTTTIDSHAKSARTYIYRHTLPVRLSHWLNVICMSFLLLSGLQIFNAHPALYWGKYGADFDPAFISIEAVEDGKQLRGLTHVGALTLDTSGVLGVSHMNGIPQARAFPAWLTIPGYRDLSTGRRWHFFFAWIFVVNGLIYLFVGTLSRHFRHDLLPTRQELGGRRLWSEIVDHARLRFPHGEEARRYNTLQKLVYLVVIFVLLPGMILTGLTMSPGFNAVAPWLLDPFGGRQSARTLHFLCAFSLAAFVVVHVAMVLLSGLFNNLRSMITGYYAINSGDTK